MHKDLKGVLLSEEKISQIVLNIASKINDEFSGQEVMLIVVLKGSMPFAADLMKKLTIPVMVDFMQVSSYGNGSKSSGEINIKYDLSTDIKDKNIIVIEDIIDSGNTLFALKKYLLNKEPKTVKICTLLDKPSRRESDVVVDYVGEVIPDEFVVGYGLDYAEHYRELPYIGVLGEWIYT